MYTEQELHEALTDISKSPVKRWILKTVITLLLWRHRIREALRDILAMFNDSHPGGTA